MPTARCSQRHPRDRRHRPRFVEGRIEQLPFAGRSFDVVVIVTVLCPGGRPGRRGSRGRARPAARGTTVIGDLGRWSAWAAGRRVKAWLGSNLWQSGHFSTIPGLSDWSRVRA
jgi:hypothetical protein